MHSFSCTTKRICIIPQCLSSHHYQPGPRVYVIFFARGERKEGYYPKAEIDKMIRAKELFILQYATDTSFFDKAEESDIEKITELGIEIFGKHGSPNYQTRLAQFHANSDIFYVLRQDELIVGYLGLFPLKHEAREAIMAGMEEDRFRTGILNPDNIPHSHSSMKEDHLHKSLNHTVRAFLFEDMVVPVPKPAIKR